MELIMISTLIMPNSRKPHWLFLRHIIKMSNKKHEVNFPLWRYHYSQHSQNLL